jgi:cell division protein FtsZ
MSMSEIQEAAELITSAVSPDANIIFGATLRPEMEDELIITVVATGFDSAYFNDKAKSAVSSDDNEGHLQTESETETPTVVEEAVKDVNLNDIDVDEEIAPSPAADFTSDEELKTAWHTSFGTDDQTDNEPTSPFGDAASENSGEDDKYDTPSFLRRKFGRKNKAKKEDEEN